MSMCLSFSDAFFYGDGKFDYYEMPPSENPTNVLQAIVSLNPDQFIAIGKDVFGYDDDTATLWSESESAASDILEKVRQTDTCDGCVAPITVYIDDQGFYSLTIYEKEEDE